jgi:hypothetical protein
LSSLLLFLFLFLLLKLFFSLLCCAPHLFEVLCCFKLLWCVSSSWASNIVGCCCTPHYFELMCCLKFLVTLNSSLQALKVVGCCCASHLLEFLLKLLNATVCLTFLFSFVGFFCFYFKRIVDFFFLNTMYWGRRD